jgi:hypothetical protein
MIRKWTSSIENLNPRFECWQMTGVTLTGTQYFAYRSLGVPGAGCAAMKTLTVTLTPPAHSSRATKHKWLITSGTGGDEGFIYIQAPAVNSCGMPEHISSPENAAPE